MICKQAAEALGAIGIESNIPLLEHSLVHDPAQEVRETCELALKRIEQFKNSSQEQLSSAMEKSPFMSVDPAAPATLCSSVEYLRYVSLFFLGISVMLIGQVVDSSSPILKGGSSR